MLGRSRPFQTVCRWTIRCSIFNELAVGHGALSLLKMKREHTFLWTFSFEGSSRHRFVWHLCMLIRIINIRRGDSTIRTSSLSQIIMEWKNIALRLFLVLVSFTLLWWAPQGFNHIHMHWFVDRKGCAKHKLSRRGTKWMPARRHILAFEFEEALF